MVNGRSYLVTANLSNALQHLRRQSQRLIWIDALCINQSKYTERNEQVQLMRGIYTKAKGGVVVWLGSDSKYGKAIKFLEEAKAFHDPEAWLASTIGCNEYGQCWFELSMLLKLDYWKRVWIIQELASARSISVLCGKNYIDWSTLVAADSLFGPEGQLMTSGQNEWYQYEGLSRSKNRFFRYADSAFQVVDKLLVVRRFRRSPESFSKPAIGPKVLDINREARRSPLMKLSLFELMCLHSTGKASDRRDKVYALVGLAADCQRSEFNIDYTLSASEASSYAANFVLQASRTLDHVFFSLPGILSWTRDYYLCRPDMENAELLRQTGTGLLQNTARLMPKSNASGNAAPNANFQLLPRTDLLHRMLRRFKNGQILSSTRPVVIAKGCRIDEIVAFLSELTEGPDIVSTPWLPQITRIPLLRSHHTNLVTLFFILFVIAKFFVSVVTLAINIYCTGLGLDTIENISLLFSRSQIYKPLRSLNLPPTDPTFTRYPVESSDWLKEEHAIAVVKEIKHGLAFIMKTSVIALSTHSTPSKHNDKRIEAYWRALVGNRTASGAMPPDEWKTVFQVILNGPSLVPDNFMPQELSAAERARVYVRPFFAAMDKSRPCIFLTKKGRIGAASKNARCGDMLCVFWGCSFVLTVKRSTSGIGASKNIVSSEDVVDSAMRCSAYLDGYMDGRAIKEVREGTLEERTFRLKLPESFGTVRPEFPRQQPLQMADWAKNMFY